MGIQKYVFFSIHNCDKHPEVPLMEIKYCTEKFLQDSGLPHITIRLCGFMQVNVIYNSIFADMFTYVCVYVYNVCMYVCVCKVPSGFRLTPHHNPVCGFMQVNFIYNSIFADVYTCIWMCVRCMSVCLCTCACVYVCIN